MSMMSVPRCQHLKVNGTQCGSPALRRKRHCFYHARMRIRQARILRHRVSNDALLIEPLEDGNAIQIALTQVLQSLAMGRIDMKAAGVMAYILQTASSNLKHTNFEPERVTDVVIDRDTIAETCIGGPQWIESEFPDQSEDEPMNDLPDGRNGSDAGAAPPPEKRPSRSIGVGQDLVQAAANGPPHAPPDARVPHPSAHFAEGWESPPPNPVPQNTELTPPDPASSAPASPQKEWMPKVSWNDLEMKRLGIEPPVRKQASPKLVEQFNEFMSRVKRWREEEEIERSARGDGGEFRYRKKKRCRGE